MANIDEKIIEIVYRITCPNSIELGEYHSGILPTAQRRHISQHLAECPHCRQELVQLHNFMSEVGADLDYSLVERLKIWAAKKLPSPEGPSWEGGKLGAPAFALRGDDQGPLMYEAEEAQLTLEIQDDPQQPGQKSVIGLVLGVDPTAWQAHLWQNEKLLDAAPVDELGNFMLNNLPPGGYKLILMGPGAEIHVPDLVI
jgi:hypothetical protein